MVKIVDRQRKVARTICFLKRGDSFGVSFYIICLLFATMLQCYVYHTALWKCMLLVNQKSRNLPVFFTSSHVSYCIIYHIASYQIISCHVIYQIISYHAISYIISYHIIYHIIPYHISYHIISYQSHHIKSYITLYHIQCPTKYFTVFGRSFFLLHLRELIN